MRLVLVGSGHVFDLTEPLRALIFREQPQVVALELDPRRYQGLMARQAGHVPTDEEKRQTPRVYRALAKFQESLADSFGVQAGSEMLVAAEAAKQISARVALVDRDAQAAVQATLKQMRLKEKLKFGWMGIQSLFHRQSKESVEAEIQRYQENPERYMEELGQQFPTLKRILIDERNQHMADALRQLAKEHERVLAVVGDGHVAGMLPLLQDLAPAVVRLKDLQQAPRATGVEWRHGPSGVGFSFTGQSMETGRDG